MRITGTTKARTWLLFRSAAVVLLCCGGVISACSSSPASKLASQAATPNTPAQVACGEVPSYPGLTAVVYFVPDATPTEMAAVQAAARSLNVTTAVVLESKAQMSARQRHILCRNPLPPGSHVEPNQELQQSLWISTKGSDYNVVQAALGGMPGIDSIMGARLSDQHPIYPSPCSTPVPTIPCFVSPS
jgi:hypothetical protein